MTVNPHVPTNLTATEWALIRQIVRSSMRRDKTRIGEDMLMEDIAITHGSDRRLNLEAFASASYGEILEELLEITFKLDRRTGKLLNGFVPRFLRSNTTRG